MGEYGNLFKCKLCQTPTKNYFKLQAYLFINFHHLFLMFPGWSDNSICGYLLIIPVTIHDNQCIQLLHYCKQHQIVTLDRQIVCYEDEQNQHHQK